VTVPVGVPEPDEETVAVKVTEVFSADGVPLVVRVVVVVAVVTALMVTVCAALTAAPKTLSPL
jgi:hypothetical protein